MEILILGGTRFVGRWIAERARERGHAVTLFHRGTTNPGLFPDFEHVHGDRDGGLDPLRGRRFDAVIDTCGYVPRIVGTSCEFLADATARYIFISSCSVYADLSRPGRDEDDPLATLDDPATEEITAATYGGLKVLCEREVSARFPDRSLVLRPAIIVGPHDPTDRFTYWPVRIASAPEVLGAPADARVELTDVRDLAAFAVAGIEEGLAGTFDISGPGPGKIAFAELARACREAAADPAEVIHPTEEFLLAQRVTPWKDLPLWTGAALSGIATRSCERALGEGLRFRPVAETVADTLAWARADAPGGTAFRELRAGLPRSREEGLIALWRRTGRAR